MAAQSIAAEAVLRTYIRRWDRRLRMAQTLLWLPRALAVGLFLSILPAALARFRPWLTLNELALIAVALVALSLVLLVLVVWLYPRPVLQAARRFDRLFRLSERVSAAYELISGSIRTSDEFISRQVEDAIAYASGVQASHSLPLRSRGRDWAIVLLLTLLLLVLLLLPNNQAALAAEAEAQRAAIEDAAESIREITRDLAIEPSLPEPQREELLAALDAAANTLSQADVSPEEAFATLSDVENLLREQGASLQNQAGASQESLNAAADALRSLPSLADEQTSSLSELLQGLGTQTGSFDEPARMQAADALDAAAGQSQGLNPTMSDSMREAADSLRQGDTAGAQSNLEQAQSQAQTAEQNAQQNQQAGEQLSESAQQAQEARDQAGQQGSQQNSQQQQGGNPSSQQQSGQQSNGGEQSSSPGEEESSQQGGQQGQSSGQQEGQQSSAQQGQQGAQGEDGEQQSSAGQQGQQGQQGGSQSAQAGGEQSSQSGGAASSSSPQQGQGSAEMGSAAAGAGDGEAGAGQDGPTGQAGTQSSMQNNNPDGAGTSEFDPVYAPTRLGGDPNSPNVELQPDTSDMPVQEGEFAQNPTGASSVPYNEVFGTYAEAANRALNSSYVPLGMQDVVRDYFTSIEPGQSGR